ncbi:adenosylcobalamin-dependent ribonucleoside-diphosphate reductase [Xanthovirga aplysinae]|uniref:adenosylcobalamin-dependent ribonucleoside-diphosphate reductase n=1 Tax=Xanthovirga aplysinae TaxID=2529853 RepID=UPI0012BC20B9|nr:adenosylcobalamin-dependent ribonucleoside-diphosphate reductase [Xanthovirga aplysinae]MTI33480.1 adenosylcobalamin-dependent ribonucleoside-diphosphate reductase [Xanthovirga aplysinae]
MKHAQNSEKSGLNFKRFYTTEGQNVFEQFQYKKCNTTIRNTDGTQVFTMEEVEVPADWTQLASDILAQKYFRKSGVPQEDGGLGPERSIKQVVHRLAICWKNWGLKYGYFATEKDAHIFYDEIVYCLLAQKAAPNSPQWFNTGLFEAYGLKGKPQGHHYVDPKTGNTKKSSSAYERPQVHACFILSVDDDLVNEGGIMDLWTKEARVFKYGSGAGSNFSSIRGKNEKLSGGGYSSGLMSFLKVGDQTAGAIKSGGTTRRAAKMVALDVDHPEIEDFINWKMIEEKKAHALIQAGYSAGYEGEAYASVSGQNSNNSVRIPNEFFQTLDRKEYWGLKARTNGETLKNISSEKLWEEIVAASWSCGDPGLQFDTTINEWHTCPEGGPIKASNPCSEYMFLDNTACNLASINLITFWNTERKEFDTKAFHHVCRLWTVVLEISVLMAQFPSKEIAQLSYQYRTIGLGFANLGGMLMRAAIPYDSQKARAIAASVSALLSGTAYFTSAEMAKAKGPFEKFEANRKHMLKVLRNHKASILGNPQDFEELFIKPKGIDAMECPENLLIAATNVWEEVLENGEKYGFRNAQVSVIAPTGTIGLLMDCDTTGIEPDFALLKYKKLAGGGTMKIINQSVPFALKVLGYSDDQQKAIVDYIRGTSSLIGAPFINEKSLLGKGLTKEEIQKISMALPKAFNITQLFNYHTLGHACFDRLGIPAEAYNSSTFNFLQELGFTQVEIEIANAFICGNMTLEGAPLLKEEHLPVFDCASRCGKKGKRFLKPESHMDMMAEVQPFISGAISKTINFPNEAKKEDISRMYYYSWQKGLKACAIYRDGSKFSQPLSTRSEEKKEVEKATTETGNPSKIDLRSSTLEILEAVEHIMNQSSDTKFQKELSRIIERKKLPSKRTGFTQKAKIGGQTLFVRTGEYGDGSLGEIFIDMYKEGVSFRSMLNCLAISVSIGLQYGVPLEEYVDKFTFTRFEPSGPVDHPNIKTTTSVLDFVFRMLAMEYLGREDLVHIKPQKEEPSANPKLENKKNKANSETEWLTTQTEKVIGQNRKMEMVDHQSNEFLSIVNGDAPNCNLCGHVTVRSGTCFKCLNCGNSLGCS